MYNFVFTHDAHVKEPADLLEKNLPEKWKPFMIRLEITDGNLLYKTGDKVIFHLKVGKGDISRSFKDATPPPRPGMMPGGYDIPHRLEELARSGVDSTILFSGTTGFAGALDPEPGLAHMQVWNDWVIDHFKELPHTFVPNAMLPGHSPEAALKEFRRVLDLGYRSVMLPIEPHPACPVSYIDPAWDPVWSLCEETGTPMTMHSGTSTAPIRYRGAGAACMNYFTLGLIAQETLASLVVSGLFDRHPRLKVINCESGADWLLWMGERLDETYKGHHFYVSPKLSRLPSEILYDHIVATTHRERGCIRTRHLTGLDCFIWSDDYPHAEGTYPNTRAILDDLFTGEEITQREKNLIVGGTAAKLYRLNPAEAQAEKERFCRKAA